VKSCQRHFLGAPKPVQPAYEGSIGEEHRVLAGEDRSAGREVKGMGGGTKYTKRQ
jgi:hypothetical protein